MAARDIAALILNGDADDDLQVISSALKERWGTVAREAKNRFHIGDRVTFIEDGRRFAGLSGTIRRKLPKNLDVELDDGRHVHTTATLLTLIDTPL